MNQRPNRKSAGQPPVSAHPAFPVIVALWFAALLGIGSMVLPLSMFENLALASGLADSFAAAQPPFGSTARIAVALVAAALGALAGILVARKVAAANANAPAARGAAKRPLSAHDELDEEGIDAEPEDEPVAAREPFAGRRRALAASEESARSEFVAVAPLPGQSLDAHEEPLDLQTFETAELGEPAAADEPAFAEPAISFAQAETPAAEPAPLTRTPEPAIAPPVSARALGDLGMVELVERFAIALQRHRDRQDEAPAGPAAFGTAPPSVLPSEAEVAPEGVSGEAQPTRPLPAALRPFGFDDSAIDDHDEAEALPDFDFAAGLSIDRRTFADRATEPAEAQDAAFEEELEETAEAEYTSLLAMKNPFAREPVRIDNLDEDGDEFGEPVVVFPGQAARSFGADSPRSFGGLGARAEEADARGRASFAAPAERTAGETERALRDALERLQKLSGAA